MRLLSQECVGFLKKTRSFPKIPEGVWSLPKKSEVFWRRTKSSEDVWSLRTCINTSSLQVLFTSKIRDHEEGIVIYSFYTWFSFLTLQLHTCIFGSCVNKDGNNSHIWIRREKLSRRREPAWDQSFQPAGVRLTPKAWELAGIDYMYVSNGFQTYLKWINSIWSFSSVMTCFRGKTVTPSPWTSTMDWVHRLHDCTVPTDRSMDYGTPTVPSTDHL